MATGATDLPLERVASRIERPLTVAQHVDDGWIGEWNGRGYAIGARVDHANCVF